MIIAALIGFLVWMIQRAINFVTMKRRLTHSLLTDIHMNLTQIKEAKKYLKILEDKVLLEGKKIDYVDRFTKTESSLFRAQLQDLPKYFKRRTLQRVIVFYQCVWELQTLLEGLMNYLGYLHEEKIVLTKKEVDDNNGRLDRIFRLIDLLSKKEIKSLDEIDIRYEDRIPPIPT